MAQAEQDHVREHDVAFLRSSEGRSVLVAYGIAVCDIEMFLKTRVLSSLGEFVYGRIATDQVLTFWQRYDAARTVWAEQQQV